MANEQVTGDMVEVSEYPHLVQKYSVQGVPQTVINESGQLIGAQPEKDVLAEILEVLGK
jgi:hypothetical protein